MIIELKGPKNLFNIVKVQDSGVQDTKKEKVTRNAEETKEKVRDNGHSR